MTMRGMHRTQPKKNKCHPSKNRKVSKKMTLKEERTFFYTKNQMFFVKNKKAHS